jgi:hypothetical protein
MYIREDMNITGIVGRSSERLRGKGRREYDSSILYVHMKRS